MNNKAGLVAALLGLVAAFFLALSADAATIRISQEPSSTSAKSTDLLLIDIDNGDGTYTTKKVALSVIGNALAQSNSVIYVTNLYSSVSYTTNLNSSISYVTNLYSYLSIITNLTVDVFKGNQTFITNLTITAPGGETNLNLQPQSILVTDDQDAITSLTNTSSAGVHAVIHGYTPPIYYPIVGNDFQLANTILLDATNMMIDLNYNPYQTLTMTNNVNFLGVTNGPGVCSIKIFPGGADRVLTFPTNWCFLRTNYLTQSGSFWTYTLTNASTGNGPRIGWLSVAHDGISTDQTNVVAIFQESP